MEQSRPQDAEVKRLMQMALRASHRNDIASALGYVKQVLSIAPDDGDAWYLSAALHTKLGLLDRAKEELERAVQASTDLDVARFQLGLVHLMAGRVSSAEAAWALLDRLPGEEPLVLFKLGLLDLANGRLADGIDKLERGITRNTQNPALNEEMLRIARYARGRLEAESRASSPEAETSGETAASTAGGRFFLRRYEEQEEWHRPSKP